MTTHHCLCIHHGMCSDKTGSGWNTVLGFISFRQWWSRWRINAEQTHPLNKHAEQADLRSKVTSKSPNPTLPGSTLLCLQAVICLIPRDTLLLSWPSRDPFAQIECWQPFCKYLLERAYDWSQNEHPRNLWMCTCCRPIRIPSRTHQVTIVQKYQFTVYGRNVLRYILLP